MHIYPFEIKKDEPIVEYLHQLKYMFFIKQTRSNEESAFNISRMTI